MSFYFSSSSTTSSNSTSTTSSSVYLLLIKRELCIAASFTLIYLTVLQRVCCQEEFILPRVVASGSSNFGTSFDSSNFVGILMFMFYSVPLWKHRYEECRRCSCPVRNCSFHDQVRVVQTWREPNWFSAGWKSAKGFCGFCKWQPQSSRQKQNSCLSDGAAVAGIWKTEPSVQNFTSWFKHKADFLSRRTGIGLKRVF